MPKTASTRVLGPGRGLVLAAGLVLGLTLAPENCAAAWALSTPQRAAVERGDVIVVASREGGATGPKATSAQAAIRIAAPPDTVFGIMTDCAAAATWVPRLVSCRVVESDPGQSTEVIAHRVDYGWFAPRIDYVFRAHYADRRAIRFEHVSGDLDENEGAWALELAADGVSTLVTYRARTRPRFPVPQWLYQRGVSTEVPGLLRALRARAEQ